MILADFISLCPEICAFAKNCPLPEGVSSAVGAESVVSTFGFAEIGSTSGLLITVLFVEGLTTVMPSMDFLFLIARSSSGERVFVFPSVLSLLGVMTLPDTSLPGIYLVCLYQ